MPKVQRIVATLLLLAPACGGDDPVDAAGDYTLAITNGDNGCAFANWTEGNTADGIPFAITQDGSAVTGTVGGLTAGFLDVALGGHVFTGDVSGADLELTLYGTRSGSQGNCTFTVNAVAQATLDGDYLEGEISYQKATNGNPDCADLEGCESVQAFNGTRPPS